MTAAAVPEPAPLTIRLTVDQFLDPGVHETTCTCGTPPRRLTPLQAQYGLSGVMCARPGCPNPNPAPYGAKGHRWCLDCRGGQR